MKICENVLPAHFRKVTIWNRMGPAERGMLVNTHNIQGKINGPVLPPIVLHRTALVTRLQQAVSGRSSDDQEAIPPSKLVLVCAPAGYGKTTLLADFVRSSSIPCCWYFLDYQDREPATFLNLLLLSIRQRFPHFGPGLDSFLSGIIHLDSVQPGNISPFDLMIDALTQTLSQEISERFVLLLCNYHEVNESREIAHLMDRLLLHLPTQCTLFLESRALPAFSTAPLLSKREMFGLGSAALRFSAQELWQLAQDQGLPVLDMTEAEHITQVFDGWILGILLGTRLGDLQWVNAEAADLPFLSGALQPVQQKDRVTLTIPEQRLQLFFSLVQELFQPTPDVYRFLKEAAILEEMTPALCNALFEIDDASEQLSFLVQQGLFVTQRGTFLQEIYVCHPLLRELFQEDLKRQAPERLRWLHQRAADLFRAKQNYSRAIWHALEAQQQEPAVKMIFFQQQALLEQGRGTTLAQWIEMLPSPVRSRFPRLQLLRARIHLIFGELDLALPLLKSLSIQSSQLLEGDETERESLQAEITLTRSRAFFQAGNYVQAQTLCLNIVENLSADMREFHGEAHHLLGVCANVQGRISDGIAHLQKALQLWGRNRVIRQTAEIQSALASSYSLIGNTALADHHSSRAQVIWEQLQDKWGQTYNLIRMGMIAQRKGGPHEAETLFHKALGLARGPIHFQRGEAYALVSLGELLLEQEEDDRALASITDGLALARRVKDQYLIQYALCILARVYGFLGDTQTALLLLSDASPEAGKSAQYEMLLYELTLGAILLQQNEYQRASVPLESAKTLTTGSGLVRERIQANIRLAASQLGLRQLVEMRKSLDELLPLLERGDQDYLLQAELRRLPDLKPLILNAPEYLVLRSHLHEEEPPPLADQQLQARRGDGETGEAGTLLQGEKRSLTVLALGEPQVFQHDIPVTRWRMARAMELCFYLLESDYPRRKEHIITDLWPEGDEHADQTFRSTVYYLKKTIGEQFLLVHTGTYTLDKTRISYDVALFRDAQARARKARAEKNLFVTREELLQMVELYRGDYVQSFYSDWCSRRRDELRQSYIEARRELAQICWQLEWFEECVEHWQHVLAVDNCLEDAHYGLMRCYLKQGKRGLALRQYQRCTTTLHDELGVTPGPTIQNWYRRLVGSEN